MKFYYFVQHKVALVLSFMTKTNSKYNVQIIKTNFELTEESILRGIISV